MRLVLWFRAAANGITNTSKSESNSPSHGCMDATILHKKGMVEDTPNLLYTGELWPPYYEECSNIWCMVFQLA